MLCKQRNATERNIITSKYIYETNCTLIFNEHDEEDEEQEAEEDNRSKALAKLSTAISAQFDNYSRKAKIRYLFTYIFGVARLISLFHLVFHALLLIDN